VKASTPAKSEKTAAKKPAKESSSSSSSSSDSEDESEKKPAKKAAPAKSAKKSSSSSSSSSSEESEEKPQSKSAPVTPAVSNKKRKADTQTEEAAPQAKRQKKDAKSNVPFKRIDETRYNNQDPELADNSYAFLNKRGESWGAKAAQDLIVVKGDRFRHEKTKKKRGSYRGSGRISTDVRQMIAMLLITLPNLSMQDHVSSFGPHKWRRGLNK